MNTETNFRAFRRLDIDFPEVVTEEFMAYLARLVVLPANPARWVGWWEAIEDHLQYLDVDASGAAWLAFIRTLRARLQAVYDAPTGVHSDIRALIDMVELPRLATYERHFLEDFAKALALP